MLKIYGSHLNTSPKASNFGGKRSRPDLKTLQIEENSATQMRKTRNQATQMNKIEELEELKKPRSGRESKTT